MGNSCSPEANTPEGALSKDIDKDLNNYFRDSRKECKVLLLGTGESGKTTIIKQLRIIHTVPFDDEMGTWKENIHSNIITSMSALVKALEKSNQLNDLNDDLVENAQFITSPKVLTCTTITPDIAAAIKNLWANSMVKDRFLNKSDVQIIDSAGYFFDNLDRIAANDYVPNNQDILFSRVRTTGITEIRIPLGTNPLRLVDVGGQRSERRKWIHCFDEVKTIFYVSAISEFDQKLREDETTNRMEDSLRLFEEVLNYDVFQNKPIILFLNKEDLLEDKIKRGVPLVKYFPDFKGENNLENTKTFFLNKFTASVRNKKIFFPHFTCATDTECIRVVFEAVQHIIMSGIVTELGLSM